MKPATRWFVDFYRFKNYFEKSYSPLFIKYYDTVDSQPRTPDFIKKAETKAQFHTNLKDWGYEVITKPLKYVREKDGAFITKGNMDIELSMDMVERLDDLDLVILVSGDSDYLAPIELVRKKGKAVLIISFNRVLSWELRAFATNNPECRYLQLEKIKHRIRRR